MGQPSSRLPPGHVQVSLLPRVKSQRLLCRGSGARAVASSASFPTTAKTLAFLGAPWETLVEWMDSRGVGRLTPWGPCENDSRCCVASTSRGPSSPATGGGTASRPAVTNPAAGARKQGPRPARALSWKMGSFHLYSVNEERPSNVSRSHCFPVAEGGPEAGESGSGAIQETLPFTQKGRTHRLQTWAAPLRFGLHPEADSPWLCHPGVWAGPGNSLAADRFFLNLSAELPTEPSRAQPINLGTAGGICLWEADGGQGEP